MPSICFVCDVVSADGFFCSSIQTPSRNLACLRQENGFLPLCSTQWALAFPVPSVGVVYDILQEGRFDGILYSYSWLMPYLCLKRKSASLTFVLHVLLAVVFFYASSKCRV